MSYKVTIDSTVLKNTVESVFLKVDTPDDSNTRSEVAGNSIEIFGRIENTQSSLDLYKWSLMSPSDPKCYKKVELEVIGSDNRTIRNIVFPDTFVVDYTENFSDDRGVGTFSIFLKQKMGKNNAIQVSGH